MIRINLEAAFRLMRAAARPMMKARFGRIVTITSVVGATGNPGPGQLRRGQGRARRHDQELRAGSRQPRHHRQLRRPGLHPHRDDRGAARRAEGSAQRSASRWAGWARARTSAPRSPSSPRRRRATSPARRCTSTAAWRCSPRRVIPSESGASPFFLAAFAAPLRIFGHIPALAGDSGPPSRAAARGS